MSETQSRKQRESPIDPQEFLMTDAATIQSNSSTFFTEMESPIGTLTVVSDGSAITGVYMESHRHATVNTAAWTRADNGGCEVLQVARTQLAEYFAGHRTQFDVPLKANGTDVQKNVWSELSRIPYGETRSYGAVAAAIGKPKASRAVGAANGRNPISIIVPCHRVIGANGALTGFGGGVDRKEWLLLHESRVSGSPNSFRSRDLFSANEQK
jgi:methylated-DNA-[protein]-cysteine S-methyltransferase